MRRLKRHLKNHPATADIALAFAGAMVALAVSATALNAAGWFVG